MIPTDVQVKEAYKKAREELKEYINSDELFNTFYTLRTKYSLHVDVAGNLALLVDAIILELVPLSDFPGLLKEILTGASETDYLAILKSVNDDIFAAFRQKTKERAEAKLREEKERAERKAKEDAEDQALELELRKQFEVEQAALAAKPKAPAAPTSTDPVSLVPPVVKTPVLQEIAPKSIIEQKVTMVSAPTQQNTSVSNTETKPVSPPRYHGTDPYREMPE